MECTRCAPSVHTACTAAMTALSCTGRVPFLCFVTLPLLELQQEVREKRHTWSSWTEPQSKWEQILSTKLFAIWRIPNEKCRKSIGAQEAMYPFIPN